MERDERHRALVTLSPTAIAATWDTDLAAKIGEVIGREASRYGVDVVLAPNVNLPRSPLSGRVSEMFSEDPFLTGAIAAAWVNGVQSEGVGACIKHLVCNDVETERRTMNSRVGDTALRETYLRPFEIVAERSNPFMIMAAYNRLNGIHCVENSELLAIPKNEWGFSGPIVSDWFGVQSGERSANAGLDLEMPGPARHFGRNLLSLVKDGRVVPERVEDMIARVMGLCERIESARGSRHLPTPDDTAQLKILEDAAASSFVLMTNPRGMLPIEDSQKITIAVVGPNADEPCFQGSSFSPVRPRGRIKSPLEAIRETFVDANVRYARGTHQDAPRSLEKFDPRTPDGQPGILQEWLDGDGKTLREDVRESTMLGWFGGLPVVDGDRPTRLRLSSDITIPKTGTWEFAVGGTGEADLRVDDRQIVHWDAPPPDVDIMGVVARCDTAAGAIALEAGQTVRLQAEMTPGDTRVHAITVTALEPTNVDPLAEALNTVEGADLVVLVVGDQQNSTRESVDREDIQLASGQVQLIREVAAAHSSVVVVVNASRAVDMSWADDVAAVIVAWYSGQQMGPALARVLHGDLEPQGRLPITFPMRQEDLAVPEIRLTTDRTLDYDSGEPIGYRYMKTTGKTARFAFGHGLSYTHFDWGRPTVEDRGGAPIVAVPVKNTGARAGREVVQLYVRGPYDDSARLIGFSTEKIEPDEMVVVSIEPDPAWNRRWGENGWAIETGVFELQIGGSSANIFSTIDFYVAES
jgi:beta-glucosidase